MHTQIARHVGPTLAQRGADRIHVGPTWGNEVCCRDGLPEVSDYEGKRQESFGFQDVHERIVVDHAVRGQWSPTHPPVTKRTMIILCMCAANERRPYSVTSSLIGWVHSQNDPWKSQENASRDVCRIFPFTDKLIPLEHDECHGYFNYDFLDDIQ